MKVIFENGKYYVECTFEQRKEVQKMGFKWCDKTNSWSTDNWYIASKVEGALPELAAKYNKSSAEKAQGPKMFQDQKLMPFQNAGVEEIISRKNVLLADEPGLGKTAQVIAFLNLALPSPTHKVLIICPASLKLNWIREFEKFGGEHTYDIQMLSGSKDKINPKSNVVIVNYDMLKSKIIFDQLLEYSAQILICDEAHYIKNAKTARSKSTALLVKKATRKTILITGTPLVNRPIELHSILKMISPETIQPYEDYRRYAFKFCSAHNGRWGFNVNGSSNEAELNYRLRATCMIRRLAQDVLPQLPEVTMQLLPFEQDKKTKKIIEEEYRFTFEDLTKRPEVGSVGDLAKIRHDLAMAKLPTSLQVISDLLETVNKVVVFAYHRDVMQGLFDGLKEYKPVMVVGGMTAENKQKAVDAFQNDPSVRVFVGQIQAAGVGITLTAAQNIEFVETSWVPGEIDQAVKRCKRIGQKSHVTARFHIVADSLDETMLKSAFDKLKTINKIVK